MLQHPCCCRTLDFHGADGAEFLTAEALDALFSVDSRLAICHCDDISGADPLTLGAADAFVFFYRWAAAHEGAQQTAECLSPDCFIAVLLRKTLRIADIFEIRNYVRLPWLADSNITNVGWA